MFVPQQGDIIYLSLDPQAGHEQMGRRPVLVVSLAAFQKRTGMAMVCPITNTDRGMPLHVPLGTTCHTTGFVMSEQVKSLDLTARSPEYKDHVSSDVLDDVMEKILSYLRVP